MNYLAHAYLSFKQPDILVGNIISDFVKGKTKFSYSNKIQKGIALHRMIDEFTDAHPATKSSMLVFKPYYRLYSAPIVDILYDYFLANDKNIFSKHSLSSFSVFVYDTLDRYSAELPERFSRMLPYMKMEDWLFNYRTMAGMQRSLGGLVRRSSYLTESDTAYRLFEENYDLLKNYFAGFFPDVKEFAKKEFDSMISAF